MKSKDRILLIESNPDAAKEMTRALRSARLGEVDHAPDGEAASSMAESFDYSMAVLELMVPKLGGPALCKALRDVRPDMPLLAVTARADAVPMLLGMKCGVDDYLFKPIDTDELVFKAAASLSRPPGGAAAPAERSASKASAGEVSVDRETLSVVVEGRALSQLSLAQFELLDFLVRNPGVAFSQEELLAELWRLRPPARLKHVGVDLSQLRRRTTGLISGLRYLVLLPNGGVKFEAQDSE